MQLPDAQLKTPSCPNPEPATVDTAHQIGDNQEALLADSRLARRCLAGEPAAWDEFYGQCHGRLLALIKVMLGPDDACPNRMDEIAARVWYALIENNGRLLARYDSRKGARLITFLRTLAKTEVSRHLRRERRRLSRKRIVLAGRPPYHPGDDAETAALLREFLPTLSTREREFYADHLAGPPSDGGEIGREPLSAKARQLRHRIREKLLRFLGA